MTKMIIKTKLKEIFSTKNFMFVYTVGSFNTTLFNKNSDIDIAIIYFNTPTINERRTLIDKISKIFDKEILSLHFDKDSIQPRDVIHLKGFRKIELFYTTFNILDLNLKNSLLPKNLPNGIFFNFLHRFDITQNKNLFAYQESIFPQDLFQISNIQNLSFKIAEILNQLLTTSESNLDLDRYEQFLEQFVVLLFLKEKKIIPSKKHWKKSIQRLKISEDVKFMTNLLIETRSLSLSQQLSTLDMYSNAIYDLLNIRPLEYINSDRLSIRKTNLEFAQLSFQIIQNQKMRLSKYLSWVDKIHSIEDQNIFINKAQTDWNHFAALHYQIFHNEKLVGAVSIHSINFQEKSFQFGYWIEEKSIGKGYIKESVQALNKIMNKLGWTQSLLKIRKNNISSIRIAEKLDYELIPGRQLSESQYQLFSKTLS